MAASALIAIVVERSTKKSTTKGFMASYCVKCVYIIGTNIYMCVYIIFGGEM